MKLLDSAFVSLRKRFREECGFDVFMVDSNGSFLAGNHTGSTCSCQGPDEQKRIEAARQTLAWGEPIIQLCCDQGLAFWGIPLTDNNRISGALIVEGVDLETPNKKRQSADIATAAKTLLQWSIAENWTNKAIIDLAKEKAERESDRFLAIEAAKESWVRDDLRSAYLKEEPGLLMAIKEGRNDLARAALNRILSCIYSIAGDRTQLLKSCLLELVVMMSRAAVESGASPAMLLGNNFRSLTDLSNMEDEEEIAVWIRNMLEVLIDSIHRSNEYPQSLLLNRAVQYMRDNLSEPLRRDDVARLAGVSPGHFNKLLTERMGHSFSDLLMQMRISRVKELLLQNRSSLTEIALDCGFCDQSHLNKVFRKETGLTPGDYRKKWLKTG